MTNVILNNGTVSGSPINVSNTTFSQVIINANTTVIVQPGTTLNYTGNSLTNNGLIQIDTLSSNGSLNFTGNTTLTGTGSIFLNDYSPNARLTTSANATLTSNQTVYGIGEIDAALINNATINANGTIGSHTLFLQTNNMTNNSLMEATNTGILTITGITITQAANASITNVSGGVNITSASIVGGTISGNVTLASTNLTNVKIAAGSTILLPSATTVNYTGATFTNNGSIQVDSLSSNATLNFTGNTTLTGTGSVFIQDYSPNARITGAANTTLTLDTAETIFGIGEIDPRLVNNGTIIGNISIGSRTLFINGPTTNNGLIQATGGGIVAFGTGATGTTLNGGTYRVDANSSMSFADNVTTNGATILLTGSAATFGAFNTLTSNVANITLQNGANGTVGGSLNNAGTITLSGANTALAVLGTYTQNSPGVLSSNGTLVAISVAGNISTSNGTIRIAGVPAPPPARSIPSRSRARPTPGSAISTSRSTSSSSKMPSPTTRRFPR